MFEKSFKVYHCDVGYAYKEWDAFRRIREYEMNIKVNLIDVKKFDTNNFKFIYKETKIKE
jgi:hypothetical protein